MDIGMKNCIYCHESKPDEEFSLEHVIPQFMGGSHVSDKFKTRDVCKRCNNNLGLFVDAAFEKEFLVFNNLNASAHAFFDPDNPSSLPLHCMGISALSPPDIKETKKLRYVNIGLVLWVNKYSGLDQAMIVYIGIPVETHEPLKSKNLLPILYFQSALLRTLSCRGCLSEMLLRAGLLKK